MAGDFLLIKNAESGNSTLTLSVCVAIYNSAAATLTSPRLVCLGERITLYCSLEEDVLTWLYNGRQVGPIFRSTDSTPETTPDTVANIMFTYDRISTDNGILVSSLSFIAIMATNGVIITCIGGDSRGDATIELGSGKDHLLCIL